MRPSSPPVRWLFLNRFLKHLFGYVSAFDGQAPESLTDVDFEVRRGFEAEFGVVGRQRPLKLSLHRLVRFDKTARGILDLFDREGVQGVFEGNSETVFVD